MLAAIARPFTVEGMFQIGAITHFISIAGHTKYGYDYFYSSLNVISEKPENALAKHGSSGVWNYAKATFFIAAALNWRWAQTFGPPSIEEELIFWVLTTMGILGGFKFLKIGYYQPLIPLWYANAFACVGYIMAQVYKLSQSAGYQASLSASNVPTEL